MNTETQPTSTETEVPNTNYTKVFPIFVVEERLYNKRKWEEIFASDKLTEAGEEYEDIHENEISDSDFRIVEINENAKPHTLSISRARRKIA